MPAYLWLQGGGRRWGLRAKRRWPVEIINGAVSVREGGELTNRLVSMRCWYHQVKGLVGALETTHRGGDSGTYLL